MKIFSNKNNVIKVKIKEFLVSVKFNFSELNHLIFVPSIIITYGTSTSTYSYNNKKIIGVYITSELLWYCVLFISTVFVFVRSKLSRQYDTIKTNSIFYNIIMNRRFGSISCVTTVAPSPGSPHHTTPWATGFSGQRVRSLEAPVRATAVSRFGDIMLKYFQMNNSVILVLFNANWKIYNINYI